MDHYVEHIFSIFYFILMCILTYNDNIFFIFVNLLVIYLAVFKKEFLAMLSLFL